MAQQNDKIPINNPVPINQPMQNQIRAHQATITTLDKNNREPCLLSIRCEAKTLKIASHIGNINYIFYPLSHIHTHISNCPHQCPNCAHPSWYINCSNHFWDVNKSMAHNKHCTKILLKLTPVDHDALRMESFESIINNCDTTDEYFIENDKIRSLMIAARYPNTDDETSNIKFIIKVTFQYSSYAFLTALWPTITTFFKI